jgi:hypothetical protein
MRFTHPRCLPLSIGLVVAALLAVGGCSSSHPQLVEKLPPPNFNGPNLAPQAGKKLPVVAQQAPVKRPAPQVAQGGVPRDWTPPPGAQRSWRWIVIHHSATPSGSARTFDRMHREKGWDELGYHFVVGNGTDSADGQIEVGTRWAKQKWGAHAKTPNNEYNDHGIGICLVGNFDLERPTAQQSRSLAKLVAHLMKTYNVPASRVLGHQDTGKPTECPGRNLNIAAVRRMATQVAEGSNLAEVDTQVAGSFAAHQTADSPAAEGQELLVAPTAVPEPHATADP